MQGKLSSVSPFLLICYSLQYVHPREQEASLTVLFLLRGSPRLQTGRRSHLLSHGFTKVRGKVVLGLSLFKVSFFRKIYMEGRDAARRGKLTGYVGCEGRRELCGGSVCLESVKVEPEEIAE